MMKQNPPYDNFWTGNQWYSFSCSELNDIVAEIESDAELVAQGYQSSCPTGTTSIVLDISGAWTLIGGGVSQYFLGYNVTVGCCHPSNPD